MKRNTIIVILLGVLILISVIQGMELNKLKDRVAEMSVNCQPVGESSSATSQAETQTQQPVQVETK